MLSRSKALRPFSQDLGPPQSATLFRAVLNFLATSTGKRNLWGWLALRTRSSIVLQSTSVQRVLQSETLFNLGNCADHCSYHRFFADMLLTPLEATRIRLVSQQNYATGLVSGLTRLAREGGVRELYAGFLPILCKFSVHIRPIMHHAHPSQTDSLCNRAVYRT